MLLLLLLLLLLLFIIYTINLLVVRPRSCRVIYYFDTLALGRRHQSFGCVNSRTHQTALSPGPSRTHQRWVLPPAGPKTLFFSYIKEKINWWEFFYIVQKLDGCNVFSFEVRMNFLIKACLFLPFKNTFKKI